MGITKLNPEICIRCKGYRNLCGLGYCPLLKGLKAKTYTITKIKSNRLEGSTPPSLVVGEKGYPRVTILYGIPPYVRGDEAKIYDDPRSWFMRLDLGEIIDLRTRLLYLTIKADIHDPWRLYEKEIGLAPLSSKPVDTEAELLKPPKPKLDFDILLPPQGPSAPVKRVYIIDNPKLHRRLEKLIWDPVKANEAVWTLYKDNLDFETITRAFSLGFLGEFKRRRIVPTRWSITAVDSIISSYLIKRIHRYNIISDILVFRSEYLYNKYTIILYPGRYSSEWIEVWKPNSLFNPEAKESILIVHDDYSGKPNIMDGGFLAARLGVLEYLDRIKRQARAIILREVLPQYMFPVGSWQIRYTVRNAFNKGPVLRNPTIDELLRFLETRHSISKDILARIIGKIKKHRFRSLDEFIASRS